MGVIASQITSFVYSTVYSSTDQRKHQSLSLAFVLGIHQWPVNFPHKWPVKRKMFPFDDVIMVGVQEHLGHNLCSYRWMWLTSFMGQPLFTKFNFKCTTKIYKEIHTVLNRVCTTNIYRIGNFFCLEFPSVILWSSVQSDEYKNYYYY